MEYLSSSWPKADGDDVFKEVFLAAIEKDNSLGQ